jgi:hypothetical protein
MEITMKRALESVQAINYLASSVTFKKGVGISVGLARKQIIAANEVFENERLKLAESLAKKDDAGVPVKKTITDGKGGQAEVFELQDGGQAALEDGLKALRDQLVMITVQPISYSQIGDDEKILPFVYGDLDWLIVPDAAVGP